MQAVRTLASLVTRETPDYNEDSMRNLTKFEFGWTFIKALRMALSGECSPLDLARLLCLFYRGYDSWSGMA